MHKTPPLHWDGKAASSRLDPGSGAVQPSQRLEDISLFDVQRGQQPQHVIGGGFPLGAVLATENAASGMVAGTHGSTYGGNPLGCAVGAKVMEIVNRAKLERSGVAANEAALQAMSDGLRQRLDDESAALFGTARLWDDGIIDPRDTRRLLGLCLAMAVEAETRTLRPNTFGAARF